MIKIKDWIVTILEAFVIAGITLCSVLPVSCKVTTEGIQILEGDYSPPLLLDFQVLDSYTFRLVFSEKVNLTGCVVSKIIAGVSDSSQHSTTLQLSDSLDMACGENGSVEIEVGSCSEKGIVDVIFVDSMEIAEKYECYGVVKDSIGNSLTFSVPFCGYNSRMAKIIMTEIQSESISSQRTEEKKNGTYRNEFVEFLAINDGNLAGLALYSAYDGEEKKFEFPPVEVLAGEVFLVHLRNRGNGCFSEIGEDLSLAYSSYAVNQVRDLWSEETGTALGNKTDVIFLKNENNGQILDGIMYRAENVEEWTSKFVQAADLIGNSGLYESGDIENAVVTTGLTATKTLERKDSKSIQEKIFAGETIEYPVKSSSDQWIVSMEASPGRL